MKTILLATFHDLAPARALKERLQDAGIPAVIHDQSNLQRFWFASASLAAVHLEVPEPEYLEACQLVEAWDRTTRCLTEAVRCPECSSCRVEFPQMTRKFVTPNLLTVLTLLGILERRFYCVDCHYTWPVAQHVDGQRDVLGWPMSSRFWHPERVRRSRAPNLPAP